MNHFDPVGGSKLSIFTYLQHKILHRVVAHNPNYTNYIKGTKNIQNQLIPSELVKVRVGKDET